MHLNGYDYNTVSFIHLELTHVDQSDNWILLDPCILGDPMRSNVGYEDLGTFVCSLFFKEMVVMK